MKNEFVYIFNSYYKYIDYRSKLLNELKISNKGKEELINLDKMISNIERLIKEYNNEDFNNLF